MTRRLFHTAATLLAGLLLGNSAWAQILTDEPEVAKGIGVEQKLGAELPLGLRFHDEQNNWVSLGDFFAAGKPVLLSFNYSNCPMLCNVQLQNLAMALRDVDLVPGKDFHIVSVSIDPLEQPTTARQTEKKYLALYGNLQTADGWHFLTSTDDPDTIKYLADLCGFGFKYVPQQRIYSHPAAFIFVSPEGRIVRYLDGLDGELSGTIKMALIEAADGKVGSVVDRVLYFSGCYLFDASQGKYTLAVMNLVRWASGLMVVGILVWLVPYWLRRGDKRASRPKKIDNSVSPVTT